MATLLRLFRKKNRWPSDATPWLDAGDVPADPLGDLATDDNTLSVYVVEDDPEKIDRVLAGLVVGRQNGSEAEYILFDESLVLLAGIKIIKTEGQTPDAEVNKWHRDLTEISALKLAKFATLLVPACDPLSKTPKEVAQILARSIAQNHIPVARVNWQKTSRDTLMEWVEKFSQSEQQNRASPTAPAPNQNPASE